MTFTAAEVIAWLDLAPHPDGGHYRETFRDSRPVGERAVSTAVYFLLAEGEASDWRLIDAAEVWRHHMGDPMELRIADGSGMRILVLGDDLKAGQVKQAVVPPGAWHAAQPLGTWSLTGCTVAPGLNVAAFEPGPPGWAPEA